MEFKPLARRRDLVVEQLSSDTLLYDVTTDRVHALSPLGSAVWRLCDGSRGLSAIASSLPQELGADVPSVRLALEELAKAGLLEEGSSPALSRRELLRLAKVAAVAAPVVVSVLAPTPALAASCIGLGGSCAVTPCCWPYVCSPGLTCE